jgi:hypothetical protein
MHSLNHATIWMTNSDNAWNYKYLNRNWNWNSSVKLSSKQHIRVFQGRCLSQAECEVKHACNRPCLDLLQNYVFIRLPKERSYCGLARSVDQLDSPSSYITFSSVIRFPSHICKLGVTSELEWTRSLYIYVTKVFLVTTNIFTAVASSSK